MCIIVTMNSKELLYFLKVRCCNRAQGGIRDLVTRMLKLIKGVAPVVFEKASPNCLRESCPEVKYKCDNPPEASDFDV